MDTQKRTRKTRSKSQSKSENSSSEAEPEVAPNLNGDETNESKGATENNDAPGKEESVEEKPIEEEGETKKQQGRKRKASEMKDDSISGIEAIVSEEKKEKSDDVDMEAADAPAAPVADESKTEESIQAIEECLMDTADDSKEIKLPPKQTLGKGKRARIPNKRYSDILLSSSPHHTERTKTRTAAIAAMENGETQMPADLQEKENMGNESGLLSDSVDSPAFTSSGVTASKKGTLASPAVKKQKTAVDLSNPNYLKPFQYGWKRELVYRATSDIGAKRNGDIYYYTPTGKKVRSMREVSENLKDKKLTLDDFTFFKEPLGIDDPEKEIIREAKFKAAGAAPAPPKKTVTPKVTKSKATSPKAASPTLKSTNAATTVQTPTTTTTTTTPAAADSPKPKSATKTMNSFKMKLPGARKQTKKKRDEEEMEVGIYPPNWQSPPKKVNKWGNNSASGGTSGKPCRPCSIRCPDVTDLIPSLQCRLCLCLYHNECVGLASHSVIQGYVCKNCQPDQDLTQNSSSTAAIAPPPPLTPINALRNVTGQTSAVVPPKLHRIPTGDEAATATKKDQHLVGSVTTWFPPSSTVQVGSASASRLHLGPVQAPRPQFVEYLGDKKYLIIPKNSVLSVSPNVGPPPAVEDGVCVPGAGEEGAMEVETAKLGVNEDGSRGTGWIGIESPERSAKSKRTTRTSSNPPAIKSDGGFSSYMDNYLQNLAYGYNTLLYVFQYLKVQDLLRAGCVCHMWRDIASHPLLWRTVRMKNSQVHSFEGLASALEKHNTVHLDLRKMLLPGGGDEIWPSFSQAIKRVDSLRKIELCRCPATVVEQLPTTNPKLEVINAVTIKCETMSLAPFQQLKNLQELRLKSTAGLTLNSDLHALKELTQLKHLSLTSIKELTKQNLDVIAELKNLESLDLGECTDFPKTFGMDILTRLTKLEKLRLEKGQGSCYTFEILEAVKSMPKLEQLELVNFDIKTGFDKALGACTNIKKLLIIPTYISQSATTNHMVLGGVLRLRSTLSHFVWGVTLELLRVTELFVDQCEEPKEKKEKKAPLNGDSIPVLKPVPLLTESDGEIPPAHDPPQVEILPLPNLQKLLLQSLPTTRVKILKIPFHATWRQSITDTVN